MGLARTKRELLKLLAQLRSIHIMKGIKQTPESYRAEVIKANEGRITLLSDYHTNYKCKIKFKCNTCGYVDTARSDVLKKGRQCKNCLKLQYKKAYTKTTEQYSDEVYRKTGGEYRLTSSYRGVNKYITMLHEECKKPFKTTPHQFNRGRRCPNCNKSKGEQLVSKVLDELGVAYEEQVNVNQLKGLNHRYSFDFYLPEYNILIEYQGVQHYKPVDLFGGVDVFNIQKANDEYKRRFASENNYYLLEIPYTVNTFKEVLKIIKAFTKKIDANKKTIA